MKLIKSISLFSAMTITLKETSLPNLSCFTCMRNKNLQEIMATSKYPKASISKGSLNMSCNYFMLLQNSFVGMVMVGPNLTCKNTDFSLFNGMISWRKSSKFPISKLRIHEMKQQFKMMMVNTEKLWFIFCCFISLTLNFLEKYLGPVVTFKSRFHIHTSDIASRRDCRERVRNKWLKTIFKLKNANTNKRMFKRLHKSILANTFADDSIK